MLLKKFLTFEFQIKKQMPFKLFEFLEQFVFGLALLFTLTVLLTLTQFEKTGSKGKLFIPLV